MAEMNPRSNAEDSVLAGLPEVLGNANLVGSGLLARGV